MSNVTPPASVSASNPGTGSPLRGTLKGALATLVLLLLALLFWQLLDQLRETQKNQRQYTIDYTADLAAQVSLNMALNAQIALNLLPIVEQPQSADEQQALLRKLQKSLPDCAAWPCSARPERSSATAPPTAMTPITSAIWCAAVALRRITSATTKTVRWCICCCIRPVAALAVTGRCG